MQKVNVSTFPNSSNIKTRMKNSLTAKIFVLGFIVLILMVPYFMAVDLRRDRENRSTHAQDEVSSKWGGTQFVTASVLQFPVQRMEVTNGKTATVSSHLFVLPDSLKIESSIVPEVRSRGIYEVMLYRSHIKISGNFLWPERKFHDNWEITGTAADFLIRVSDVKGIEKLEVKQGEDTIKAMPGSIITCPVKDSRFQPGDSVSFTAELDLKGCSSLLFHPIGRTFELAMNSSWAHPSFTGGFLPSSRTVTDQGFSAEWNVSELNSSFPQAWTGKLEEVLSDWDRQKSLGVSLLQPAGTYQQVERVSNYAFMVIAIILAAFLIGEYATKIWIHPVQYFFVGLSLVMFYVLLLAFAEHMPFIMSYLLTMFLISGLTTMYCRMIFEKKKSAAILLGGVMLLAYLLIFVLIRLEDYALLAGSIILLALLAILMRATGNMNKAELQAEEEFESIEEETK